MKKFKKYLVVLLFVIFTFAIVGCEKEDKRTRGEKITDGVADVIDGLLGD